MYAAIGRHPNSATGFDDADLAELRALAAHEKCVAIGETGLDFYRDYAPRADQERAFRAQIELAHETGKPLVIHTRAAEDDTLAMLSERAAGVRGDPPLLLDGRTGSRSASPTRTGGSRSPATSPTPRPTTCATAAIRVPAERLLVETDAPYLSPQAVRGKPNQPANVVHTAQALALERRVAYEELERAIERSAAAVFGWSSSARTSSSTATSST